MIPNIVHSSKNRPLLWFITTNILTINFVLHSFNKECFCSECVMVSKCVVTYKYVASFSLVHASIYLFWQTHMPAEKCIIKTFKLERSRINKVSPIHRFGSIRGWSCSNNDNRKNPTSNRRAIHGILLSRHKL